MADDIVGYTFQADTYCPNCIGKLVGSNLGKESNLQAFNALEGASGLEDALDYAARVANIHRTDERSFDSGEFPKVIFETQLNSGDYPDVCGTCNERLDGAVPQFFKPTEAGYTSCVACGDVALGHILCGWCQDGAREYNSDPDSVYEVGFDSGNLGYWATAGELLADAEQAKHDSESGGSHGSNLRPSKKRSSFAPNLLRKQKI